MTIAFPSLDRRRFIAALMAKNGQQFRISQVAETAALPPNKCRSWAHRLEQHKIIKRTGRGLYQLIDEDRAFIEVENKINKTQRDTYDPLDPPLPPTNKSGKKEYCPAARKSPRAMEILRLHGMMWVAQINGDPADLKRKLRTWDYKPGRPPCYVLRGVKINYGAQMATFTLPVSERKLSLNIYFEPALIDGQSLREKLDGIGEVGQGVVYELMSEYKLSTSLIVVKVPGHFALPISVRDYKLQKMYDMTDERKLQLYFAGPDFDMDESYLPEVETHNLKTMLQYQDAVKALPMIAQRLERIERMISTGQKYKSNTKETEGYI